MRDHYPVFTILKWGSKDHEQKHREEHFRDFKNFDHNSLLNELSNESILFNEFEDVVFVDI